MPMYGFLTAGHQVLATPLAVMSADQLPLFMDREEWMRLPKFAEAKRSTISVSFKGFRTPFQTGNDKVGYANSTTYVELAHCVGINEKVDCMEGVIEVTNGEISKIKPNEEKWAMEHSLYGHSDTAGTVMTIGANTGVIRHWNKYLSVIQPPKTASVGAEQTMHLLKYYTIQNAQNCMGAEIINHTYNYRVGLLKGDSDNDQWEWMTRVAANTATDRTAFTIGTSGPQTFTQMCGDAFGSDAQLYDQKVRYFESQRSALNRLQYATVVEKAAFIKRGIEHHNGHAPPLVCFGMMPLQANALAADGPVSFSDLVGYWEIKTTMDVEVPIDSMVPYSIIPSHPFGHVSYNFTDNSIDCSDGEGYKEKGQWSWKKCAGYYYGYRIAATPAGQLKGNSLDATAKPPVGKPVRIVVKGRAKNESSDANYIIDSVQTSKDLPPVTNSATVRTT